jgi:hypothetical protein
MVKLNTYLFFIYFKSLRPLWLLQRRLFDSIQLRAGRINVAKFDTTYSVCSKKQRAVIKFKYTAGIVPTTQYGPFYLLDYHDSLFHFWHFSTKFFPLGVASPWHRSMEGGIFKFEI